METQKCCSKRTFSDIPLLYLHRKLIPPQQWGLTTCSPGGRRAALRGLGVPWDGRQGGPGSGWGQVWKPCIRCSAPTCPPPAEGHPSISRPRVFAGLPLHRAPTRGAQRCSWKRQTVKCSQQEQPRPPMLSKELITQYKRKVARIIDVLE